MNPSPEQRRIQDPVFTDEDIEVAKRCGGVSGQMWIALLTRLEAAEKCIVAHPTPIDERFEAWRKASGK